MTHQLNLDGVLENLIVLQHFAHGSNAYCRINHIGSEQDQGDALLDEYWAWVKGIVSTNLLECSIKFRLLQDVLASADDEIDVVGMDSKARVGIDIGKIIEGDFDLTLREACNKIMHARTAMPLWADGAEGGIPFKYWSGNYELTGEKGREKWRVVLYVPSWARSMEKFLREADELDATFYVGQDWH